MNIKVHKNGDHMAVNIYASLGCTQAEAQKLEQQKQKTDSASTVTSAAKTGSNPESFSKAEETGSSQTAPLKPKISPKSTPKDLEELMKQLQETSSLENNR